MPNLSLPTDQELDADTREFLHRLPKLNVWWMLARTGVVKEFQSVLAKMFEANWLPSDDREIILFRTCQQNKSTYELKQHIAFGFLDTKIIDAIMTDDLDSPALSSWQRKLCTLCDEIAKQAKLSKDSVKILVDHYGNQNTAARAIFIMSWFNMLSRFVDSTDVPIETGIDPYKGISSPTKSE